MRSIKVDADALSFGFFPLIYTGLLVSINVVDNSATPNSLPSTLPDKPAFLNDLQSVTEAQLGGRFVVEITPTTTLNREDFHYADYFRYFLGDNIVICTRNPVRLRQKPAHQGTNCKSFETKFFK